DFRAARHVHIGADGGDAAVLDDHRGALEHAFRPHGVHHRVGDGVGVGLRGEGAETEQQCGDDSFHHSCPPISMMPSSKSVFGWKRGSSLSQASAPSMNTFSAREYTLNGLPLQITTSAILPASSEPVCSSMPSDFAALSVSQRIACSGVICMPTRLAAAMALAASWLRRWMPGSESECTVAQAPAAPTRGMFPRLPSKASILKPHQSAHIAAQVRVSASLSAIL